MTVFESVRERAILSAAEEEFMTKGYDGAKTESIAKTAGVTHAMLHYYFRTKENLFNKVFFEKLDIMVESLIDSFSNRDEPFLDRIQHFSESHFDFLVRNPNLPRFVINEIISKPERIDMIHQKINRILSSALENLNTDLQEQIKLGKINDIKLQDILLDIVSVNVFVFVAFPIIKRLNFYYGNSEKEFWENRKKESVRIIMSRLIK